MQSDNTPIRAFFRPFLWLGSVLGALAVGLELYSSFSELEGGIVRYTLFGAAVLTILLLSIYAGYSLYKFYFEPIDATKLAEFAFKDFENFVPEETVGILKNFFASIFPHVFKARKIFEEFKHVRIQELQRSFKLSGRDVEMTERYKWTNATTKKLDEFPIISFGGSIQTFEDSEARSWEIIEGNKYECNLSPKDVFDRVLLIIIRLSRLRKRGESSELYYCDQSPGAMLLGWDIVFASHPAYFPCDLGKIYFEVNSDTVVLDAEIYSLSIISGKRRVVGSDLKIDESGKVLTAEIESPLKDHLYFILFQRELPTQDLKSDYSRHKYHLTL